MKEKKNFHQCVSIDMKNKHDDAKISFIHSFTA